MHLYKIDDGEGHWVSAESEDDALRLYACTSYGSVEAYLDEVGGRSNVDIQELEDDQTVAFDDEDTGEVDTRRAIDWCKHRGVVGSTCY
jgi:hypothetical protein